MTVLALSALVAVTDAHGGLTFPPPRNNYGNINPTDITKQPGSVYHSGGPCAGDECLWFNQGCWIGCSNCSSLMPNSGNYYGSPDCPGSEQPVEPSLPDKFRTWNIGNPSHKGDWTKYHPWRAPGRAPVVDPCGMAGGYTKPTGAGGQTPVGSHQFARGSELPKLDNVKTEWLAGDVVEVGWMVGANHGGGYIYSLCPASEELTEECFQANTLPFVGEHHTIRYMDTHEQLIIPATDVSEGTFPAFSTWRRNPIPACNCDKGFGCGMNSTKEDGAGLSYADEGSPIPKGFSCPTGTQFPVPFDYGYGQQLWNNTPTGPERDMWSIVDRVRISSIPGEYVLRWRWDAEQNPQVWTHCADVTVVSGDEYI